MKTYRALFRLMPVWTAVGLLLSGASTSGAQNFGTRVATSAPTPPGVLPSPTPPAVLPTPTPPGVPAAPTAPAVLPAPTLPSAPPALDTFARTWADITAYSATVTVFEQKGAQVQNVVFDYSFHKPSSVTVHVVSGPNAGATLVWNGASTVSVRRGSGLAALFKKTLSLHDSLVTTIRGSSIDQLSFGAILAHSTQTPGALSEHSGDAIDGVATNAVTLVPLDPAADAGFTREVIEISTTTHLPMRVLGYEGLALVRKIDFSNVKLER